jgi:hypothetical protein
MNHVVECTSLLWIEHIKKTERQDLADRKMLIEQVVSGIKEKETMRSVGPAPTEFPIAKGRLHATIGSLPSSIQIEHGEIKVRFQDSIEALQLLYRLGLARNGLASPEPTQHPWRASAGLSGQQDIQIYVQIFEYVNIQISEHRNLPRYL